MKAATTDFASLPRCVYDSTHGAGISAPPAVRLHDSSRYRRHHLSNCIQPYAFGQALPPTVKPTPRHPFRPPGPLERQLEECRRSRKGRFTITALPSGYLFPLTASLKRSSEPALSAMLLAEADESLVIGDEGTSKLDCRCNPYIGPYCVRGSKIEIARVYHASRR